MAWDGSLWTVGKNWTLSGALVASALPAAMYALQNSLLQLGYRHLDSLTFSMLNQSKLLFTAIFMFLLLGIRQSSHQIGALAVLLGASLLLCLGESSTARKSDGAHVEALLYGVLPTLVASILSGLASSLCQWASQVKRRSSYLMTIEMSTIGTLCLVVSLSWSPDGHTIRKYGFFYGWTIHTLIPVFANAIGGILVGLVTTAAGGVRKGFVIVNALLVTAFLQLMFEGKPPSFYTWSAMPLVVSSVILYQRYPYREKTKSQ
ncbi:hypothetical protein KP509_32G075100 [Ceratopteris richardii]|nr:hypothetical protein KP509_32G075100 [Ceratopteris richardii]